MSMTSHYFTVEEANALLPIINPLMDELMVRRAIVVNSRREMVDLLNKQNCDVGGRAASDLVKEFIAIESLAKKIRSYGCIIRDLNRGLIDFLATRDGREVFLCWQHGELKVEFYHELHSGFSGRQRI
jgi:hypothetical protein